MSLSEATAEEDGDASSDRTYCKSDEAMMTDDEDILISDFIIEEDDIEDEDELYEKGLKSLLMVVLAWLGSTKMGRFGLKPLLDLSSWIHGSGNRLLHSRGIWNKCGEG